MDFADACLVYLSEQTRDCKSSRLIGLTSWHIGGMAGSRSRSCCRNRRRQLARSRLTPNQQTNQDSPLTKTPSRCLLTAVRI